MRRVVHVTARPDPYAILDDPGRGRPFVAFVVPLVIIGLVIGLLTYVAVSGDDDDRLPPAPSGPNVPGRP